MFYSVDEDGNIIMSDSIDILPEVYKDAFSDLDDNVSSGDETFTSDLDFFIDLLANIPSYNVYPNTNAVNVFSYVLNSVDGNIGYVLLSGSDTNSTYLYYSNDFIIDGNNITLLSPVTFCNYYSYRPTSSSNYIYTYNVSVIGDTSFNITNQLVYTNLLDGYPDLIPYKSRDSYSLIFIIALFLALLFFAIIKNTKRGL